MEENQNQNPENPNPQFNPNYNPYDHPDSFFYERMHSMSWDMKFLGIVAIIGGAIACLSIIGALIGIPTIISGIRLKDAGEMMKIYLYNNDRTALSRVLDLQSRYFHIQKILTMIGIIIMGIYFLFLIVMVLFFGGLTFLAHKF